ncbi:hypothetical protein ANO14919_114470 [Xylariales sp. No.14919]|nr:hypothetical protein ANO14919_114470 [Xylariales sp. No.14919]
MEGRRTRDFAYMKVPFVRLDDAAKVVMLPISRYYTATLRVSHIERDV